MAASPVCTVNGSSTTNGVNVTPSTSVTIALASITGVDTWSLQCTGTDENNTVAAINAGLSVNTATKTASFTAPLNGAAVIFQSQVNSGTSQGKVDPSLTTTFGVYTTSTGDPGRVMALNERLEGNAAFGWITKLNNAIRTSAQPTITGMLVDASSGSVAVGDSICINTIGKATRAIAAALAVCGAVLGTALNAAGPGGFLVVQMDGVLPPSVSGLASFGPVRSNTTTGRLEVVASYQPTDYPIGFSTSNGWVTMVRGLAVGATAPFDFASAPGLVDQFDGNTATVGTWTSLVGTNSVVQATGGNRPTILTSDLNGRNAVNFNGSNQWMETSSWSMSVSTEWTCYAVMSMTGTDSAAGGVIIGSTAGGGTRVSLRRDNSGGSDNGQYRTERTGAASFPTNGVSYPVDMRAAGYRIVAFQARSDATNEMWIDGTSRGTWTNADAPCYNILTIGRFQGGILYSTFKIAYWLNYNSRHDTATVANVHGRLRAIFPSLP